MKIVCCVCNRVKQHKQGEWREVSPELKAHYAAEGCSHTYCPECLPAAQAEVELLRKEIETCR